MLEHYYRCFGNDCVGTAWFSYHLLALITIGKSVTFVATLLKKEDVENYKWLCEAFKKVFREDLKCIVTDQDLQ